MDWPDIGFWLAVGLILVGAGWIVFFVVRHFRALAGARAARSWPWVEGSVVSAYVGQHDRVDSEGKPLGRHFYPVVRYTYTVGGRAFEGERLQFGQRPTSDDQATVAKWIKAYRLGERTQVRYDPENPAESVLETVTPSPVYLVTGALGLVAVAMGIWALTLQP